MKTDSVLKQAMYYKPLERRYPRCPSLKRPSFTPRGFILYISLWYCYVIRLSAWEGTHTVSSDDITVSHGSNRNCVSRSPNLPNVLQELYHLLTESAPPKSFCFVQTAVKPVKPIGYRTVNPRSYDRDPAIRSFIHRKKKNYVEISVLKNLNTAFT
jgi:hypothetical protein